MTKKRMISLAMALLLVMAIPLAVVAQEYDLSAGSITVRTDDSGQYVSQADGVQDELQTSQTVIKQESGSASTDNTITISTSGSASADITIRDLNVAGVYDKSVIDVGSSAATIRVEGENKIGVDHNDSPYGEGDTSLIHVSDGSLTLTSETGGKLELENAWSEGAVIGSDYEENFSGDIHITGNIDLAAGTTNDAGDGAGIGSGQEGDFSGNVTIDGDAKVTAIAQDNGAGIGSGQEGEMSGTVTIGGNAQVSAASADDGAGIGSGDGGKMSGTVIIGENAVVKAGSCDEGAGIGSGEDGQMSGTVTIGGNAQVTAISGDDGAGIGSGEDSQMSGTVRILDNAQVDAGSDDYGAGIGSGLEGEMSGTIIIGGSARVTASGDHEAAGIGSGSYGTMTGIVIIRDSASVTANAGREGSAAIGGEEDSSLQGIIAILGDARVTTGVIDSMKAAVAPNTGEITLTVATEAGKRGNIGGRGNAHNWPKGNFIFDPDATINGIKGDNTAALNDFVNFYPEEDGSLWNYICLDVGTRNGEFFAEVKTDNAQIEGIYYGGGDSVPTARGRYPIVCRLFIYKEEGAYDLEIGELVIPEGDNPLQQDESTGEPLYRVTDQDGRDVPCRAKKDGAVYTITTEEPVAILTGKFYGIAEIRNWGVEEIVFQTPEKTSVFRLDDLLELGSKPEYYFLTHDGGAVSFTVNQESVADILK